MAQTPTHPLTRAVFVMKPFLRPCGASGVVCGYPYPGLIALGYYPTPLRGLVRRRFPNPGLAALGYYPTPLRGGRITTCVSRRHLVCALSFPPVPALAQSVTGAFVGRVTDPVWRCSVGTQPWAQLDQPEVRAESGAPLGRGDSKGDQTSTAPEWEHPSRLAVIS